MSPILGTAGGRQPEMPVLTGASGGAGVAGFPYAGGSFVASFLSPLCA